ncbi:MAG: hypothetical protein RLZZ584_2494 [Pseudomonadota bacterium]
MLTLVFGPSRSHGASMPRADANVADVCFMTGQPMDMTLQGVRTISPADDGAPAPSGQASEHCSYCTQPAPALGMPVVAPVALPLAVTSAQQPAQFRNAPRRAFVWLGAPPRAPPVPA